MMMKQAYASTFIAIVVAAALLLPFPSYGQEQCSSSETPDDLLGPFYLEGSEMSNVIAPDNLVANPSLRLFVYGKVLRTGTCEGVPDIVVEAWYAGPPDAENDYYQANEHRGQVTTNAVGEYNFTQLFPTLYPDRPIIHNHFRLSTTSGEELLVTQMYFYGTANGYVTDRTTRTLQAVDTTLDTSGARQAKFNMYITTSGSTSKAPTNAPTKAPTSALTKTPTKAPTKSPTEAPTKAPASALTKAPTKAPTKVPTNPNVGFIQQFIDLLRRFFASIF